MNIALRASVGLLVVLVGMCIGGVGRVVGAPPAPDATLTITPKGETHGGLNGYVLASPEAGGKTGVTMKAALQNFTTKELSDSGGASDETQLEGEIEHVKFPVWVVKLEARMTAFAKADFAGDPQQGSYEAFAKYRLVYKFSQGGGDKAASESVTLKSDEVGPLQTDFVKGKLTITDRHAFKKLDSVYRSECEGSIKSSRPEPTIECGAHHLDAWTGTAIAYSEKTGGLVVIIRPDGTNAEWNLK